MKVLIAGDEVIEKAGSKTEVPWVEQGFEIAGEVSTAKEAIEACQEIMPDILLIDIHMRDMGGLQLIEHIKKMNRYIKIVVLSSSNELELIKRAMRLGADDYLLKLEFEAQDLMERVNRLKEEIVGINSEKKIISEVKTSKELQFKAEYMKKIIWSDGRDITDLDGKLKLYGINVNMRSYAFIVIEIDDFEITELKWKGNQDGLFSHTLIDIAQDTIDIFASGFVFENNNIYIAVVNILQKSEIKVFEYLHSICGKIKFLVHKCLGVSVTIGVSNVHSGFMNMVYACNEAKKSLEKKFFLGNGKVIFLNDTNLLRRNGYGEKNDEEFSQKAFKNAIEDLDVARLKELIKAFFIEASDEGRLEMDRTINRIMELLYLFKTQIQSMGYDIDAILGYEFNPLEIARRNRTFNGMAEEVNHVILVTVESLIGGKQSLVNGPVQRAMEYIEKHFYENISLLVIAEYLDMNASYFSNLFKTEIGENFIGYLTRIRIENAKKMIRQRKYKIYEIAEKVGYANEAYFSTIFKKYTGVTPKEYRKTQQK